MRRFTIPLALVPALMIGCAARTTKTAGTLAELRDVKPDVQEAKIEQGLDQAMEQYRRFLEETPKSSMAPEAMRRLADLQIEKQFGINTGDTKPREMPAPESGEAIARSLNNTPNPAADANGRFRESDFR